MKKVHMWVGESTFPRVLYTVCGSWIRYAGIAFTKVPREVTCVRCMTVRTQQVTQRLKE